jgi:chitin disaccharide deacetylase
LRQNTSQWRDTTLECSVAHVDQRDQRFDFGFWIAKTSVPHEIPLVMPFPMSRQSTPDIQLFPAMIHLPSQLGSIAAITFALVGTLFPCGLRADAASNEIRLLVRGDDMGMATAVNHACIESYREGIVRSVEIMVPCPWFLEAVRLLRENPDLDVGVHLTLTSEWENLKWRPLTQAPSLVDANGYFFPMVWPNPNLPPKTSLRESSWKLAEVEAELRAQIETALRHLPRISHLSAHMGFTSLDPAIATVVRTLAREYNLESETGDEPPKRFPGWGRTRSASERIAHFVQTLESLEPGTHLFVEHPAYDVPEMQALGHKGYEDVATDRAAVTAVFTSPEVKAAIQRNGIRLISYQDLKHPR